MTQVNVHEAKTNLSRLIAQIKSGEQAEIVIAQNGVPAARLVPLEAQPFKRRPIRFGLAKGQFKLPEDFDADNDYIAKLFNGEDVD